MKKQNSDKVVEDKVDLKIDEELDNDFNLAIFKEEEFKEARCIGFA